MLDLIKHIQTMPVALSLGGVTLYLCGFALSFALDNALPTALGVLGFCMVLVDAFRYWSNLNDDQN